MIPAAFGPFLEQTPLCVMARTALESLFRPEPLDALFRDTAQKQYQKELLFSQLVELMTSVVLRVNDSVHDAYRKRAGLLPVSDQAVYDKLRCMEPAVSAALVADSAARVGSVIDALGARLAPWLPGYRVQVIDGNHLSATQRRLRVLRQTWAAALPGTALAVYEPERDVVTQVFLTPDGHAQERSLLGNVLDSVQGGDLWIADRNFCTLGFLFGLARADAAFVLRQHGNLPFCLRGERRACGRTDSGVVYEQAMELTYEDATLPARRITLVLDKPTRNGDAEVHVATNLPQEIAGAAAVAELYRKRWTIEKRFYEVTQTLDCEPNTLGYPKAALFAFSLALAASNAVALLKASLRAAHGEQAVAEMSSHHMASEVRQTYRGMMVALPPPLWAAFAVLPAPRLAETLRRMAEQVKPAFYRKARRGPKKPRPPRDKYKNARHVSTQRLLDNRRK
jgi:IS4 transposase